MESRMKKLALSLVLLVFMTCGCTNVDTQLTINKDKSASVNVNLNYAGNLDVNEPRAMTITKNYKKFLDEDYKMIDNDEVGRLEAEKSVPNLEKNDIDLSSLGFVTNLDSGRFIDVKKNFFVTSYNVDMHVILSKAAENIDFVTPESIVKSGLKPEYINYLDSNSIVPNNSDRADFIANYENNLNLTPVAGNKQNSEPVNLFDLKDFHSTFSIKVPSFASYNNADNVNGNIYSWNIKKDAPTVVRFQYVVYSGFGIGFILLLGIGILIYIAKRILRHEAQKRIGDEN